MTEVAVRAAGLLAEFNTAGVLDLADVHVARRVAALGGEQDESVRLAVALAVRALRLGSVCVDLRTVAGTALGETDEVLDTSGLPWPDPEAWVAACRHSPLVADGEDADPGRPLRFVGGLLYLDRYWRQEEQVRLELRVRALAEPPEVDLDRLRAGLARLFPGPSPDRQRLAAAVSALRRVTVLAGGPGTGKTTTVARLLALLHDQPGRPPRVALAAPTGKAAARLEEAVREGTARLPEEDRDRLGDLKASTLHRLLGVRPGSRSRFRHDRYTRLPYDLIVVDETSMVSLTLMARLLEAVPPAARLVLVGDPDQLASVEAGAVLGDLVRAQGSEEAGLDRRLREVVPGDLDGERIVNGVVMLRTVHRFHGTIADVARAFQDGDADEVVALLRSGHPDLEFVETDGPTAGDDLLAPLWRDVVGAARELAGAAAAGDTDRALHGLDAHRLLCGHRLGPYGVRRWTAAVERRLAAALPGYADGAWYPGRPLLVTANDYELGLYNGDSGVVVRETDGTLRAAFARGGEPARIAPGRLSEVQTMHAMTVHRAQGSQFRRVSLVLPPAESPLLTRELVYTAITRARESVRVIGIEEAVRAAVGRPIARASGLRDRLMR